MATFYKGGTYKVKVVDQRFGMSKNEKNLELQLVLQPTHFRVNGEFEECQADYTRTQFITLNENTLGTPDTPGWVAEFLAYMGFDGERIEQLDPDDNDHISFVGCEVEARCKIDTWNGQDREKWTINRPGQGGQLPEMASANKAKVKALNKSFGAVLSKAKEQADAEVPFA